MTFGSLFSGIGGFDLGLERAGMECRWQVEIDPFCRKVLAKHWPDVPRYEDVRDVGAHNLEPVDLICGGFPCQDISYAGKGAGLEGERSGLWYEFARIIGEMGPRYAVVENVPALLTRGLGDVLGTLASLGYNAEWTCLPAASVGAPHIRDRVFVLAHTGRISRSVLGCGSDGHRELVEERGVREEAKRGDHRKLAPLVPGVHPGAPADWWRAQSRVARSTDGAPNRLDRLTALGNAVVPQVAEWIGQRIMEAP